VRAELAPGHAELKPDAARLDRQCFRRQLHGAGAESFGVVPGEPLPEIGIVQPRQQQPASDMMRVRADQRLEPVHTLADRRQAMAAPDQPSGGQIGSHRVAVVGGVAVVGKVIFDHRSGRADRARDEMVDRTHQIISVELELLRPYHHARIGPADHQVHAHLGTDLTDAAGDHVGADAVLAEMLHPLDARGIQREHAQIGMAGKRGADVVRHDRGDFGRLGRRGDRLYRADQHGWRGTCLSLDPCRGSGDDTLHGSRRGGLGQAAEQRARLRRREDPELALENVFEAPIAAVQGRHVAGGEIGLQAQPRDGLVPGVDAIETTQDGLDVGRARFADHRAASRQHRVDKALALTHALDLQPFVERRGKAGQVSQKRGARALHLLRETARVACLRGREDRPHVGRGRAAGQPDAIAFDQKIAAVGHCCADLGKGLAQAVARLFGSAVAP